ncbi:hypothetical protein NWQ33_00165, partial [Mycoplasmopsis cynos]|nr:hypothetical protein [Mycoplasmopsis cynos]
IWVRIPFLDLTKNGIEIGLRCPKKFPCLEDGNLLKATVYADVMTMDERLLTLLLSDEKYKEYIF